MASALKKIILLLCVAGVFSLSLTTPLFAASDPSNYGQRNITAGRMTADLVVIRPLAIVGSVFGCAIFLASLPFSLPGGNTGEVWNVTVKDPVNFAFVRPLGDFPN